MKLKPFIIIASVIVTLAIIVYFSFFETIGIVTKRDDEAIVSMSTSGYTVAAVADSGDVYVRGRIDEYDNYGIERVREYNHLLTGQYTRIYDKKDATSVKINISGGCIITNKSDVYVFINGLKEYQTPTYLCSGFVKAIVVDKDIYLLSDDGEFGFINIEKPNDFCCLGNNVADFDVEYIDWEGPLSSACFVLTNDNRLYVSEMGKSFSDSEDYIDNVVDFDVVAFCADLSAHRSKDRGMKKYLEIGLLDDHHQAYYYEGYLDEEFSRMTNKENYVLTGSNVDSVVSFPRGVAMLNRKGELALYGYGSWHEDVFFTGETVLNGVRDAYTGEDSLIVLYKNNDIDYYGLGDYWGKRIYSLK